MLPIIRIILAEFGANVKGSHVFIYITYLIINNIKYFVFVKTKIFCFPLDFFLLIGYNIACVSMFFMNTH